MNTTRHFFRGSIFGLLVLNVSFVSTMLAQEPQSEAPQPPKIIRKSGGVLQGSAVKRVEPAYPPLAKAARISGSVVVEVTVDEEGNVISARAISGHPLLKDPAVGAAREWKFNKTLLQGVAVKVIGTITFNFNMGEGPDTSREIEEIKTQIAADPNSAELYQKLGSLYRNSGRNRDAIEAFSKAVQLYPRYNEAYLQLGSAYLDTGDNDKAIEAFNQSLALEAGDAQLYVQLSMAYLRANREGEALDAARLVLKLNPNFDQSDACYALIGFVLLKQGHTDEAIAALKQGANLGPNQNHFHLYLGRAYAAAGDRDAAMREYAFLKERRGEMAEELMEFIKKH